MNRKEEVHKYDYRHAAYRSRLNNEKIKYNKTRTKLLLYVDVECNRYIKDCKVRFNSELPREINRQFEESCTISFSNPIVTSFNNKKVIQMSNKPESSIRFCVDGDKDSLMLSSNRSGSDFGKCVNEIGKEFIDQMKISVSYKKLQLINLKNIDEMFGIQQNNPSKNSNSATRNGINGTSLIQIKNDLNGKSTLSSEKTRNLSSRRFIFPDVYKHRLEEIIPNKAQKEEKEAKKIQEKFNKLQILAYKLKNTGNHNRCGLQNEESVNITKFNGELFDILKYKGLNFECKITKENYRKNIPQSNFKEENLSRQNPDKYYIQYFPPESDRITDDILKNIHIKTSANAFKNPFRKVGDKVLNSNGFCPRRDMKSKPISRTTKESGKLAAIIKKIRENLFKINQRNFQDSSYPFAREQDDMLLGAKIKNKQKNKMKTPYTNYNSNRNSINTQSKQEFPENSCLQEEYEVEKKVLDSSIDVLSDCEINSRISSCSNLYQQKSPFENYYENNYRKGNLLNLITIRDASKFRSMCNSNLSRHSEASRYSNSIADSACCSIISKDPSNITRSSITKSDISNDFDYD